MKQHFVFNECLVIVDMQERFQETAIPSVTNKIISLVEEFKRDNQFILTLEFGWSYNRGKQHNSPTYFEIKKAIGKYRFRHTITKYRDGGGDLIHKFFLKNRLSCPYFLLTGVNLDFCVYQTAMELRNDYNYKVDICRDASNFTLENVHPRWSNNLGYENRIADYKPAGIRLRPMKNILSERQNNRATV